MKRYHIFLTFILLLFLAGALRFYKLGEWSFWSDELPTQAETFAFFEDRPVSEAMKFREFYNPDPEKCQLNQLPRLIPLAHSIHYIDYKLFGTDEFGSRVLPAVFGTLAVGIVFLLGVPLFGYFAALILAVLLLLFPDHIFYCQYNRFHSQTFLLIAVVLVFGGYIAKYSGGLLSQRAEGISPPYYATWALLPLSVMMVLTNSLTGVIWGILLAGLSFQFLLDYFRKTTDNEQVPFSILHSPFSILHSPFSILHSPFSILICISVILLLIATLHIYPLAKTWNSFDSSWYTPTDMLMEFIAKTRWVYFFMIIPMFFIRGRAAGLNYWLTAALGCLAAVFFLTSKIVFYPSYLLYFSFPFLVIAALFIDAVRKLLASRYGFICGLAWCLFAAVILNVPELRGYYKDGNRPDYKGACLYIRQHWQDGDQLVIENTVPEIVEHYIADLTFPVIVLSETADEQWQQIFNKEPEALASQRYWILLGHDAAEKLPKNIRREFYRNAELQTVFGRERYDKPPRLFDIFLLPGNADSL